MEWNRGPRPNQPAEHVAGQHPVSPVSSSKTNKSGLAGSKLASLGLLFGAAILILGVLSLTVLNSNKSEQSFVNDKQMQAVFLNGGQVYFGKISDLNSKYIRLADIYYLRVNQQVQPNQTTANATQQTTANDISLVKLGCELHGPQDSMVINQDQVIFWENLKTDGQVAKAVADYKKANPQGQKCDQTTTQQSNTNATGTTPATGTETTTGGATNTTPTTGTTTKKQ